MVKSNLSFRTNSDEFSSWTRRIIFQLGNENNYSDEENEVEPPKKERKYYARRYN